ncbi:unnamed protein product [Fraxinus pennsylvanica]|uniref:DUF7075 domain-containing protein n=1 Tax=Fraxinus pennsylvanica TaxID=56036 RepID=A0AAD2DJK5_9LAMI|nr:unnamed protein product [Fraxinus pennsylvanica]
MESTGKCSRIERESEGEIENVDESKRSNTLALIINLLFQHTPSATDEFCTTSLSQQDLPKEGKTAAFGVNAMKRKRKGKDMEKGVSEMIGETANVSLPMVELDGSFSRGKYLIYSGGGDRCKSMHQFLYSFNYMLGEAQYLNRTLILDSTICLPSIYTSSGQDEDDWNKRLTLHLVEDYRITPMELAGVEDPLIMSKFGTVEPDNYWYRVYEGETD